MENKERSTFRKNLIPIFIGVLVAVGVIGNMASNYSDTTNSSISTTENIDNINKNDSIIELEKIETSEEKNCNAEESEEVLSKFLQWQHEAWNISENDIKEVKFNDVGCKVPREGKYFGIVNFTLNNGKKTNYAVQCLKDSTCLIRDLENLNPLLLEKMSGAD